MKAMEITRIKKELNWLKEKIDEKLPTRTIAIWLFFYCLKCSRLPRSARKEKRPALNLVKIRYWPERSVTMSTPSKSNNSKGKVLSQQQLAVATNALRRILRNVEILERIKKDIYRVTRILS